MVYRGVMTFLLCLALLAGCQVEDPPQDDEAAIRRNVAIYDSAWLAKDVAAVDRLLSPDYSYFTSNGALSPRAATLEFLRDSSYHLTRSDRSAIQVVVSGPVARLSSRWEGSGRYRGAPVLDDQTCGQTWVRAERDWKLFTEHCVNRPLADSSGSP